MTLGNFSQREGSVFTVNLPDGSSRYILLQKVDALVELLQENYQGGKEPINPIEELDGLISVLKQIDDEIEEDEIEEIIRNTPPNVVPNVDVPFPQETEATTETTEGVTEEEKPPQQISYYREFLPDLKSHHRDSKRG